MLQHGVSFAVGVVVFFFFRVVGLWPSSKGPCGPALTVGRFSWVSARGVEEAGGGVGDRRARRLQKGRLPPRPPQQPALPPHAPRRRRRQRRGQERGFDAPKIRRGQESSPREESPLKHRSSGRGMPNRALFFSMSFAISLENK
jgi:hypothetical protein